MERVIFKVLEINDLYIIWKEHLIKLFSQIFIIEGKRNLIEKPFYILFWDSRIYSLNALLKDQRENICFFIPKDSFRETYSYPRRHKWSIAGIFTRYLRCEP